MAGHVGQYVMESHRQPFSPVRSSEVNVSFDATKCDLHLKSQFHHDCVALVFLNSHLQSMLDGL